MSYFFSFSASYAGQMNIVENLLSKGADVSVKNRDGQTALHLGELI
jgi:ankyrin repeat protein